nr:reverse transcriptase domain-containing protein [Tanacetum cinerariifolium]
MANVPSNDPNVDAPAIVPAHVNPDHAPAQPVGLGNGFTPHWIRDNIPNNQNGLIEEDAKEEEKDPEEDPKEDPKEDLEEDDDVMEMDDEAEVIDPYMEDGSNNPPPLNSKDEETPPTSTIIPDADGQPIPPIASFGQNFHFGESSSTANLLSGNSKIVPTGPMCPNLGTTWKRLGKMEKLISERIDTEGRVKKKFKEQDNYFVGLGCDNIEMDRTVRNVMSDFSGLKKLVKDLSDRFDEYQRSKVFYANRDLEKELVNERNGKEFYREFGEYMSLMLQNRQKSEGSFPLRLSLQVREPPAEPSARHVLLHILLILIKSTRGNPPPPLTQDIVNRMIQESVKAAIRAERERVQNEANRAEGTNIAPVARECTFADFMKCSPITFHGNEGAVCLIRWIEKTEMVFTVRKCTEANKVVFTAATFQDQALTWWNSQVATLGIEAVTKKTWAEMKVMMTEEFCPPVEIQRMESKLWNLKYRNPNQNHQNNQRQSNARAMTKVGNQNTNEARQNVKCNRCGMQHYGNCPIKCNKCRKIGYKARDCWSKVVATGTNAQPIVTCYGCGEKGHIKTNCPARNNPGRNGARGQSYSLRDGDQNLGPVTGTFLLNNRYARVLFDSGSDKSFMNVNFSRLIDIEPVKVNHSYEVELADGRVVSTNSILRGCALNLVNHQFEIDLMPIELGTFDVIIGMDWLILHDTVIVCGKKEVHVPL